MTEAKTATYQLTDDDMVREAAIARDKAAVHRKFLRMQGYEEGLEEARPALFAAFSALVEALGVGLDASERERWHATTGAELTRAIVHLAKYRALPPR